MNLTEYNESTCVKVIVFGPPKSGKTALLAQLATAGFKLHVCDLEQGIKTLLNPGILDPKFRENISVVNIPDHRLKPVAISTVKKILSGSKQVICFSHGVPMCPVCAKIPGSAHTEINLSTFTKDDILVIDTLSQLSSSALNFTIKNEIMKPGGEEYKPTFNDYMAQGAHLDHVLSLIQALNLNILVLSHDIDIDKKENSERLVPLGGTRNFSKTVAKYFDVVGFATIVNKKHRVFTSSTYSPDVLTGSRLPTTGKDGKDGEISMVDIFRRS